MHEKVFMLTRFMDRSEVNLTQPGDRLCNATLKTSMQVKADATLVDVETAGMMEPALTLASK